MEAKELGLVGKVELRIALADSDVKLEAILAIYLAPLLLKLASQYPSVRNKGFADSDVLCFMTGHLDMPAYKYQDQAAVRFLSRTHVDINVCTDEHVDSTILLPVAALLKQFKEHPGTPLVRHFDLLYIQQGIDRLPFTECVELLPLLVQGISKDASNSANHGATLFNLLLRLLPCFALPERGSNEDGKLRDKLGLDERPEDAQFMATWFGKAILLNIAPASGVMSSTISRGNCPGLTADEYEFLTLHGKKDTWNPAEKSGLNLTETKVALSRLLASGAFLDQEKYLPAIFASADANSRLSEIGDDILKRASAKISLEDPDLVSRLFQIYLGNSSSGRPPVRSALQRKIIILLSKSVLATSHTESIALLIENDIIPMEVNSGMGGRNDVSTGLEASKLRQSIFSFITWVARMGAPTDLQAIASELIGKLRGYIEYQGWPNPKSEGAKSSIEMELRGYAYESIGLLAKASPAELVSDPSLDLLRWLFRSLSEEGSGADMHVSIEQALSSVLGPFSDSLDSEVEDALRSLLLQQMSLAVDVEGSGFPEHRIRRSTKFVAVRFANRCLSYDDIVARWIDLLAIGSSPDERMEVIEEGKKGLDPHWYQMLNTPKGVLPWASNKSTNPRYRLPDFTRLVRYVLSKFDDMVKSVENNARMVQNVKNPITHVFGPAVAFCRRILLTQALLSAESPITIDVEWERKLDSAVASDELARTALRTYFKAMATELEKSDMQALLTLLKATFDGLVWNGGQGLDRCGEYFVELSSLCTNEMIGQLAPQAGFLSESIFSNQYKTRTVAAQATGILASHRAFPIEALREMTSTLLKKARSWRTAVGAEVNQVHGSLLALAFLLSRLSYRQRLDCLPDEALRDFVSVALTILMLSNDNALQDAVLSSIDQLSLFSVLRSSQLTSLHTFKVVVQKLSDKARSGNEKAILALGHLAMIHDEEESQDTQLNDILEQLYKLHDLRQPEVYFAVGEALSCVASGWNSKSLIAALDVEGPYPESFPRHPFLPKILDKVLRDCTATKPSLRKASSIWLLCLVQYCGHLHEVQIRLRRCQTAFKGFLADRDELTQSTCARGLTLVYEKGDKALKDDLVRDLVGSFTGTSANLSGNVTDETELFEPGALPTGEGSVTTYKDIMSLASEVGDPSLVYRFMSLASDSAIWSRRAAFGGLGSILSDSSVDGYLAQNPKLYPKLFRYRFDPNTQVQKSMNDIWTALVKDSTATIDKHFDAIMEDLLKSILGKEWRVRQASCAAMADLVQGRPLEKYENYLNQIWSLSYKVLDDIKESVRGAAMNLARVLTRTLIYKLEAKESTSQGAEIMLRNVMPFLLSPSGLEASAQEVQVFALDTLLQIIKQSSAKDLRPFVPTLVERLLLMLSSLEPQAVNYLHLNASKYDLTEQKIDDMRLSNIRASPLMEAIERSLDRLDEPTMEELVPALENAIRGAVGLPSKVGCSRVLVSLSTRHSFLFGKHAGKFLKMMEKFVLDRNDTVGSSFAMACGYLTRLASDKQIVQISSFSKKLYFESQEDQHRVLCGDIIYAISKQSADRFSALAAEFLPFVFVAKHDSNTAAKELFGKAWDENVAGPRAVVLYLKEITELAGYHLDSTRHAIQHACALAIAEAATSFAGGSEPTLANAELLWPRLEKAIGGKSWDGKELVLEAFVKFVEKGSILWKSHASIAVKMRQVQSTQS
ncbi:MAG: proteasome component M29 [Pycnora praestabilis]|nr:MAG: proteasome component M29 [Pycnora praestabilis]